MSDKKPTDALAPRTVDYVASAAKALLGAVPFVGSLLVEIAGFVIPNQRLERIALYAQELSEKLSKADREAVRSRLTDESFTDLMEEGLRQAARSISDERRSYIASVIANSLSPGAISHIESKHLLRILSELNDIEVIRLGSRLYNVQGSGEAYRERHREILEPVGAHLASSQEKVDKETLQDSYDAHLAQLGLLSVTYRLESGSRQPKFHPQTGAQEVHRYELTALGRLLLREAGVSDEPG